MKTFYTLLLAFGLCFTSHAQNIIDFNSASSQLKSQIEGLQQGDINRLLFQSGFSTKHLSNNNQGIKLLKVVGTNSISDDILNDYSGNYSSVKVISFTNITTGSDVLSLLDLTAFSSLDFILVNTNDDLNQSFVKGLFKNVKLPSNVTIVIKKEELM